MVIALTSGMRAQLGRPVGQFERQGTGRGERERTERGRVLLPFTANRAVGVLEGHGGPKVARGARWRSGGLRRVSPGDASSGGMSRIQLKGCPVGVDGSGAHPAMSHVVGRSGDSRSLFLEICLVKEGGVQTKMQEGAGRR